MTYDGKKIIGAGVLILLLVINIGSIGLTSHINDPQPLGILEYEPKSHDFGDMYEGETNSTVFDIWTSGGCCELIFNLTWDCPWVTVFPTSGVTNGEHIPITVTIDTTGLDNGLYGCDIQITTNGGGDGIFNATVNIISHTYPALAFYPQSHYFGILMEGVIEETTFEIWNSGSGTVIYDLSWDEPWVSVSPTSGSSSGEHDLITVTIDTTGLPLGSSQESYIDITSNGGNKVFALWVIIGTTPKVEIENITGGLFRVNTVITNTGTEDAIGLEWKISLSGNGLILYGKETTGKLPILPIGEERTISSGIILGFGDVEITVSLQNPEALPIVEKTPAKLYLFYIKI
jgi:Viral BACON domain